MVWFILGLVRVIWVSSLINGLLGCWCEVSFRKGLVFFCLFSL